MKPLHLIRWIVETHLRVWRAVLRGHTVSITRYFCVFFSLLLSGCVPVEEGPATKQIIDPVLGPNFGVAP